MGSQGGPLDPPIGSPWTLWGPWAMGPWTHGPMGPWALGPMDPWTHGPLDPTQGGPGDPREPIKIDFISFYTFSKNRLFQKHRDKSLNLGKPFEMKSKNLSRTLNLPIFRLTYQVRLHNL